MPILPFNTGIPLTERTYTANTEMDDVNLLRDLHEIGFNSSYEDFGEASSEEELEIQQPTEE